MTGLLLVCLHTGSYASEKVEKIVISADHMNFNIETGYSVYTGNVKISQGELLLTGDKVTLQQNSNNEIEQMTVDGDPARYNHITDKGEPVEAEARHMVYISQENKLIMTVDAKLKQPDQQLSSQKIIYNTLRKIIIAGGDDKTGTDSTAPASVTGTQTGKSGEQKQRVNITLTPKKQLLPEEPGKE